MRTDDTHPAPRRLRVRVETTKNRPERMGPESAPTGELLSGYLDQRAAVRRAPGPLMLSDGRRDCGGSCMGMAAESGRLGPEGRAGRARAGHVARARTRPAPA